MYPVKTSSITGVFMHVYMAGLAIERIIRPDGFDSDYYIEDPIDKVLANMNEPEHPHLDEIVAGM